MRGLLLDTHVWFWHLVGSPRMPVELRSAIDDSRDRCWLSPVSVWELGKLAERGRIEIELGYREWVEESRRRLPLHDAPLTSEIALRSLELELAHEDPADRFLAATALVGELTLATLDQRLTASAWLPTLPA